MDWLILKVVIICLTVYGSMPYDFCSKRFLPLIDTTISTKWQTTMHPRCTSSKLVFVAAFVLALASILWLQIGRGHDRTLSPQEQNYHLTMCIPLAGVYVLTLVESLLIPDTNRYHYALAFIIASVICYITIMSVHNYGRSDKTLIIKEIRTPDAVAISVAIVLGCIFVSDWKNERVFALFEYTLLTFFCAIGILLL